MAPADDAPPAGPPAGPHADPDRLRHALLTPLTVIRGRAYLLARAARRSPTLAAEERDRMLAGLAAIDAAADALLATVDAMAPGDGRGRTVGAGCPPRLRAEPPRRGAE